MTSPDAIDRDRRAVIDRAIREIARASMVRPETIADLVATALATAARDTPAERTPRERGAAARRARSKKMNDEMIRLENEGRGREAASLVARKFATDPRDPIEVESLARKLRRWRRRIPDIVRLLPDENTKG